MFPILFFLSCASAPPVEEATQEDPASVSEQPVQSPESPSQSTVKEPSNTSIETPQEVENIPIPKIESIPSPQIEGMATKKKAKKITAEEINSYFEENKTKFEQREGQQTEDAPENIVVHIEKIYNAHYNDSNSRIFVRVYKDPNTIGASFGHDHVILAHGWEGQVIWKEAEPHNCLFEFQIPVHFLEADPDDLRAEVGFAETLSAKDKKQIQENMLSQTQLWAAEHPHINFSASSCRINNEDVLVTGNINIRGKSIPIETTMTLNTENGLQIQGTFHLKQTSFGITPYSGMMGAVKLKNRISIDVQLSE